MRSSVETMWAANLLLALMYKPPASDRRRNHERKSAHIGVSVLMEER
jgi:hypothetical protein